MRWNLLRFSVFFLISLSLAGCSASNDTPVLPVKLKPDTSPAAPVTQLLGYYDVSINTETGEIEYSELRSAQFTMNIVKFLNEGKGKIFFLLEDTELNQDWFDVILEIGIVHPLPDNPGYDAYDVRGVVICDGSASLEQNPDLIYPVRNSDQYLLNADGYTRWFNKPEFGVPGIFGYIPGEKAIPGSDGNATLNPYRYFTDWIGKDINPYGNLIYNAFHNGAFESGNLNVREYKLRFPIPDPGAKFGYAVTANWTNTTVHPSNAPEAVACAATVTPDIWYTSSSDWGGSLIVDFGLICWNDLPSKIYIESTVLNSVYELSPSEMSPVEQGSNWVEWHFEVPADKVGTTEGHEFWIIAEFPDHDYTNPVGVPNDANTATLTSYFRWDIPVGNEPWVPNMPPEVVWGVAGNSTDKPGTSSQYQVVAEDPEGDDLTYNWYVMDTSDYSIPINEWTDSPVFTVDWGSIDAEHKDKYWVNCMVYDPYNDGVLADIKDVVILNDVETLYYYDAMEGEGDLLNWSGTGSHPCSQTWSYCPGTHSWDENNCQPYTPAIWAVAYTPYIQFPDNGTFENIHLEIWHWCDIPEGVNTWAGLGYLYTNDTGGTTFVPNWELPLLIYEDGKDFNDTGYESWVGTWGNQSYPLSSHFTCNAYAGQNCGVAMELNDNEGANPGNFQGWNVRKIWVWIEPL